MRFMLSIVGALIAVALFFVAENHWGLRAAIGLALFVLFSTQMGLILQVGRLEKEAGDTDSDEDHCPL